MQYVVNMERTKIFVTYAWDGETPDKKVLTLVADLRKYGYDAFCDIMKSQEVTAINFHEMMAKSLQNTDKVIVVLSEQYKKKADSFAGGVGEEYRYLISDCGNKPQKYILVTFEKDIKKVIPDFLQGREVLSLDENNIICDSLLHKINGTNQYSFPPVSVSKVLPATINVLGSKYIFRFQIDINGDVVDFEKNTLDALKDWYENKATDIISEMRNESLRGTFKIELEDLRIHNIDTILGKIYHKISRGEELSEYESYVASGVNVLKRDNTLIVSAIEFLLAEQVIRTFCCGNGLYELLEMIKKILMFRYSDLSYKIPNNKELISIDVYLNYNGQNARHERFVANIKENYIMERFGGTSVWDLCGRSIIEVKAEVAIYYLMYLAELDICGFDFSKDDRMLNPSNFWIGLH